MQGSGAGRIGIVATAIAAAGAVDAAAAAEVRVHEDYVAVVVEAEAATERDERWVLTEPTTPAQENDPDGNHSDQAVGQAYLELLPDVRVTHDDAFGPPTALWGNGSIAPQASWPIEVPEAGRYHVHVRLYSTGTEDNGLHVGLDDEWPESGRQLQGCTSHLQSWAWTSRQRNSGGVGPCGVDKTIWLDIAEPGAHTLRVGAREDGFELDRLMLIKDRSDNTRVCHASGADDIVCEDGSIEVADGFVDLAVALEAEPAAGTIGDEFVVLATLDNDDGFDTATDIELVFSLDAAAWAVREADERCTVESGGEDAAGDAAGDAGTATTRIACALERLAPTAPGEAATFALALEALAGGALAVEVAASAAESDDASENDVARLDVDVELPLEPPVLGASVAASPAELGVDESASVEVIVGNEGEAEALDARAVIALSEGLEAAEPPAGCSVVGTTLDCALGTLGGGSSERLVVPVVALESGTRMILVEVDASNAEPTDAFASLAVVESSEGGDDGAVDGGDGGDGGATDGGAVDGGDGASDANADGADEGDAAAGGPVLGLALLALLAARRRRASGGPSLP